MPTPTKSFEVIELLCRHEVEFIVVGMTAGILQGAPAVTFDLDILYARNLLLICLLPALLLFAAVPAVLFALMVETARERAAQATPLRGAEYDPPGPPTSGHLLTQYT